MKLTKFVLCSLAAALFAASACLAQSAEFNAHMKKAKEYESQKKWTFALGEYYDALGTDDEMDVKEEAYTAYNNLADAIKSGNPGLGKYNDFTIHDEWKNLLMDAERYGSSFGIYELWIGDLTRGELNYENRTATYSAQIIWSVGYKYLKTINVIAEGYMSAYKEDWKDLPLVYTYDGVFSTWPRESVSSSKGEKYNINGALVFKMPYNSKMCYYNAFAHSSGGFQDPPNYYLYDYKFNIIDENGKEIIKAKRWLLGTNYNEEKKVCEISFSGISPETMELIDDKKAHLNLVGVYLGYGSYNSEDDDMYSLFSSKNHTRTFANKLPEVELPIDKRAIHNGCFNPDKTKQFFVKKEIAIDGRSIDKTIKDKLFEVAYGCSFDEKDRMSVKICNALENYNDFIYAASICNRLSEIFGLKPVYCCNGINAVSNWPWRYFEYKWRFSDSAERISYKDAETIDDADGFIFVK